MLLVSYFVIFSIHEGEILSFFLQGLYQRLAFITILCSLPTNEEG